jgi:SNF2 family DNA or RNA helicase
MGNQMDRNLASKYAREMLNLHGLSHWGVRLNHDATLPFLGKCLFNDECIVLNSHHIDQHPEPEIKDTVLHEIAHALVGPKHGHDSTWVTKAKEIGVNNLSACSTLSMNPEIINAIRSGAKVEITFTEEMVKRNITVEEKVFKPKYAVTRLQERCPDCNKVAVEKFSIDTVDKEGNQVKLITLECFHIIKRVVPKATPFETMLSNFWKDEVKTCKHVFPTKEKAVEQHIPSNRCEKCGEFKLYNFQVAGARNAEAALAVQKGYGIFDEMGLGKTVQALAIVRFHKQYHPTMIVTKSAIKFQWFKEAIRWCGPEFISQIISTGKDYLMPGLKLYIIPYDLLRRFPKEKLYALGIKLVILDEVQQIKNADSTRTQEVRKLVSSNADCKVLPLSATPWKNRGSEFFPALNLIDPIKFGNYQHYLDRWVDFYFEGAKKKMGGIRNPAKFKEYVASLLIRREYNEVMDEFPDVNRMKLNFQLDDLQQSTYDDSESEFVAWYNQYVIGGDEDKINGIELLAQMARMRHIVGLAKIPATLGFIEEFVEDTEKKLVVFVHHKDVGQLLISALTNTDEKSNEDWHELAKELVKQGIPVFQYTSQHTGKPEGYEIQDKFNAAKRCIMIASTLACGEGLNLQTCADSIMHERQWNPQNEDQATPGRFRRIGQTSDQINITFPEGEGTIDADLDFIVENKRRFFHAAMNKGEQITWDEGEIGKLVAQRIVEKHKTKKQTSGKAIKTNITAMAR